MSLTMYSHENVSISQAEIASRVTQLLPMLELEYLESALHQFFEGASDDTRSVLSTLLESDRSHKRSKPGQSTLEGHVQAFLEKNKTALIEEQPNMKLVRMMARVTVGLSVLQQASELPTERYKKEWDAICNNDGQIFNPVSGAQNRQKRVFDRGVFLEAKSELVEAERRIGLLHLEYEILYLRSQFHTNGKDVKCYTRAAMKKFSELAGVDVDEIVAKRKSSSVYRCLMEYDFGLGLTLMLGTNTRKTWERALSAFDMKWILKYCEENLESIIDTANDLTPLARQILERQFRLCGTDPTELAGDGHIFSRYFSWPCHSLETLAAVAIEVRSTDSSFPQALKDQATMVATSTSQASEELQANSPPLQLSGNHSDMVARPSTMIMNGFGVPADNMYFEITDGEERMHVPGHLTRPAAPPMLEPAYWDEFDPSTVWRETFGDVDFGTAHHDVFT